MNINNVTIGFILYMGEIKMFKYKITRKKDETTYSWFVRTCFKNGVSPKELFQLEYDTIYYSKEKWIGLIKKYLDSSIKMSHAKIQRFCSECMKESYNSTGELLFEQSKQSDLYTICPIHNKPVYIVNDLFLEAYDYDSLVSKSKQIECSNTFVDSKTSIFAKLYFNKFKYKDRLECFSYIVTKRIVNMNSFTFSKLQQEILCKEPLFKCMILKNELSYSKILEYLYLSDSNIETNMSILLLASLFEDKQDFNDFMNTNEYTSGYTPLKFTLKLACDYLKENETYKSTKIKRIQFEICSSKSVTPMKNNLYFVLDRISNKMYLLDKDKLQPTENLDFSIEDEILPESPVYQRVISKSFKRRQFRERIFS